ncbi:hypothetical protein A1Q1_04906 [Trichosporon asahii var. asahii CBS 2479]|uniref:UTP23 sensor motif region domain-containing protein n=1 Tax=Trichosporon asahii var. asahii (strain ATCC 90039 / CBS 2479 / JCM 2466 / KCTC 7840 / NBRC 103889/ NCYC 2677 / UAMH 7654) TaxID=1186058 RepID=J4UKA5_TRIAS|nr:hypothetical protein A1Q1_04906 [Trichosporon asahii var. asahii CBS 2479]EJT52300.1 hypothetical protein A1Q1_04906 [Trichosporon asahii var. asahii CBS 2479]
MRQKRAKAYKRVMALYVSTFGFRLPYQVLLSDGFLLESAKQKDIDTLAVVRKVLGLSGNDTRDTKFMITQCCMEALYKLGKEYQHVVASKVQPPRGDRPDAVHQGGCETNKHRYVLCTASQKFLGSMSRVPGLPIVHYNSTGVLVLSPPSQATVRAKLAQEEEKRKAGAELLDGVVDGDNVKGAPAASTTAEAAATRSRKQGPKAPNPLSMKKKKRKVEVEEQAEGEKEGDQGENGGEDDGGRRKKKRKRGRGKGAVAEAISEIRAEGEEKRLKALEERAARDAPAGGDSDDDSD